jgi:hypothetical protein
MKRHISEWRILSNGKHIEIRPNPIFTIAELK